MLWRKWEMWKPDENNMAPLLAVFPFLKEVVLN
jgi:hypothetical protein